MLVVSWAPKPTDLDEAMHSDQDVDIDVDAAKSANFLQRVLEAQMTQSFQTPLIELYNHPGVDRI